jgi:hypothetical protein
MAAGGGTIRLQPQAVASLVAGEFTGDRPARRERPRRRW